MECCVERLKHGLPKNKFIILGPEPLLCQMGHLYFLCIVFILLLFPLVFNKFPCSFWRGSVALSGIKRIT